MAAHECEQLTVQKVEGRKCPRAVLRGFRVQGCVLSLGWYERSKAVQVGLGGQFSGYFGEEGAEDSKGGGTDDSRRVKSP